MSGALFSTVEKRRTFYSIGKDAVVPDAEIEKIILHAVKNAPTAFNSQSGRVVLLLGKESDRLWDIAKGILKALVPPESFSSTEAKLNSFQSGYGTVLFFEDQPTVKGLQENFPLYADNFPVWSLESSGMLQYAVWLLLQDAGFGVSLQHYNPLIDEEVRKAWGVPESWKLLGEMPFGKPTGEPDPKTFLPIEDRVRIVR
jgi:Predicted oxidoreductase related to nitroreductase